MYAKYEKKTVTIINVNFANLFLKTKAKKQLYQSS